jgi:hypothetical protein
MKHLLSFLLFSFVVINFSYAQVSTNLVTITEGSPVNSGGLGYTFYGKVMNDGNMYFRGSSNGLREAIWKTDGTIQGTSKLIEEENTFGGNWDRILLLDEGVLLNDNDGWSILSSTTNSVQARPNLPAEYMYDIFKVSEVSYLFTTDRDDDIILYRADNEFDQIVEIGNIHTQGSSISITAGSEGAISFNTNSFQEDFPMVYLRSTDQIMAIEDYFSSLSLSYSSLNYGYIYDKYLIISYADGDNFSQNGIINMKDGTITNFTYIWEPISFHDYEDKFVVVTQKEVVSINKSDLSFTKIFDQVFSFSTSKLIDDKMYVIGRAENFSENIVEVDLTENTFRYLDNARTGSSFYDPKMEYYEGKFYYLAEEDHQLLMTYDFVNNTSVVVDTLSTVTGATVNHALVKVNDQLVISKRITPLQHELYVLGDGGPSAIHNLQITDLDVVPSISNSSITVNTNLIFSGSELEVSIFNNQGALVMTQKISNDGILTVSNLPTSTYYGVIKEENKAFRFKFIKI